MQRKNTNNTKKPSIDRKDDFSEFVYFSDIGDQSPTKKSQNNNNGDISPSKISNNFTGDISPTKTSHNPTQTGSNKQKSKFCLSPNPIPESTTLDEDYNIDSMENVNRSSRSRSTYENKRPTFLQNKLKPIDTNNFERKSSEIESNPSIIAVNKRVDSGEIRSPVSSSTRLTMLKVSNREYPNHPEETKDNGNSMVKLKSEIKFYNFLMLWISIIRETCQKITDDLKMPDSKLCYFSFFLVGFFDIRFEILV